MRLYKCIKEGYIIAIGTGAGGEEIAEDEYNEILETIQNKPLTDVGYDYRLLEDLTWERVEVPVVDISEQELSAEEALDIILGGAEI